MVTSIDADDDDEIKREAVASVTSSTCSQLDADDDDVVENEKRDKSHSDVCLQKYMTRCSLRDDARSCGVVVVHL